MTPPNDTPVVPDRKRVKVRQYAALAGIVLATVGFAGWALWTSFQPKGEVRRPEEKPVTRKIQTPGPADPRDVWIAKSEEDLLKLKQERKELEDNMRKLREELDSVKTQQKTEAEAQKKASQLPPLPPAPASSANASVNTGPAALPPPPGSVGTRNVPPGAGGAQKKEAAITELVIPLPETPKAAASRNIDNYIPAGSFGRAILLTGLDAPTGGASQNNPVPFVVKLKDHGRLPNGFRSRVKACHVVLAGYGDISSERVYARTETLSCVLKDGRVLETPLKGYVSGEDGKTGMRGRLVSKQGALIARSLLAGIFGGIGEGISTSYQTVTTSALGTVSTVDPNKVLQQGVAEGFGTALDRISKWYLERADETYPVIEVDAARVGDIVLTQGASIGEDANAGGEGPRRPLVTDEELKKAATLEKYPWHQK
ncbi:TrbI/VirB10 family protein [Sulfurivermis fontis]|uniref:TrbI/VirB10 family protein n=1 Tax=Sulfurivermis fontis TaxID=1972068 RepID=UPI000FDAAF7D|nr:TrbI/VirB10 family protein [Sulfurivermis fontis]